MKLEHFSKKNIDSKLERFCELEVFSDNGEMFSAEEHFGNLQFQEYYFINAHDRFIVKFHKPKSELCNSMSIALCKLYVMGRKIK